MTADEVLDLVGRTLAEAEATAATDATDDTDSTAGAPLAALATVAAKAGEPGIVAAAARLGVPLLAYDATALAERPVPHPSEAARRATGAGGVAEAAALLAAGPGAVLVVPKRKSARATCAVARGVGTV
ncbi:hypothetical protein GCM10010218_62270 [Streptomyces mashuensis]|uniref:CobE/GbiG C-terminal domain-containing protein n=1 Tax=Streptomyces mashuensis TaxID=33904 RepID=A0A919BAN5_9ACTN|nr:hypothetical protein GCM10010218_62270 [Streptomyces mashuensis]